MCSPSKAAELFNLYLADLFEEMGKGRNSNR